MRKFLGLTALLGCACSDVSSEHLQALSENVESSQRNRYYDVSFTPAPSYAALAAANPTLDVPALAARYLRELATQGLPYWSSGSLTVPMLDTTTKEIKLVPAPAAGRLRFSCGVTLISPSFAITAGHCVTADDGKLEELKLQMYRPTAKLAETWSKTSALSGTFPLLSHPQLTTDDGYIVDEYSCSVLSRCYSGSDTSNCKNAGSDVALLQCAGRPGDEYGFLNLATAVPAAGTETLMHWKHEVLDLGDPVPTDLVEHYQKYPSDYGQNYHYFETGNQLLPLRSITWSNGAPTAFIAATRTDLRGCHGSSGSGILSRNGTSAAFDFVAPVATGGSGLTGLCESTTSTLQPGSSGLGISFATPAALLEPYAEQLTNDCNHRDDVPRDVIGLPFTAGSARPSTLFSSLSCQVDAFGRDGTVAQDGIFGPYPERFVDDTAATEHVLHGFQVEPHADYRFAVQAQSLGACAACPAPTLRVGTSSLAVPPKLTDARTLLTRSFAAESAGPVELGVDTTGSALAVGGLSFIREGQINSFDAPEDRLETVLYAVDAQATRLAGPVPMRFSGDGEAGFLASLRPGERMALLRQALGAGRKWTVRLGASDYTGLKCGLLDLRAAPLLTKDCSALFVLDDALGTDPRLALYVELPLTSEKMSVDVTYVAVASDLARDPDEDGVPDVLDNCPGDWNAAQADCSEEKPIPPDPTPSGEAGAGGAEAGSVGGETAAGGVDDVGSSAGNAAGTASTAGTPGAAGAPSDAAASGSGGTSSTPTEGSNESGTATAAAGSSSQSSGQHSGCSCQIVTPHSDAQLSLIALGLTAVFARRRRSQKRTMANTRT